jgi:hypothetical protein
MPRGGRTNREQHLLPTLAERIAEARGRKDGEHCPISVGSGLL